MKIDTSLLNDSPLWNREVARFLHDLPVYSRQDNLNAHRKLHVQPGFPFVGKQHLPIPL